MTRLPTFTFIAIYMIVIVNITWSAPQASIEKKIKGDLKSDDILNVCLDSPRHKNKPGPEKDLIKECEPWKENACCTAETVEKAHSFSLYNFNYDMCPEKNMSEECKTFFIRDTCFYECSPNIGPWKIKANETDRAERFRHIPLCSSECTKWYEACAEDYTCVDNWSKNYNSTSEDGNICKNKPDMKCKKISDLFKTAVSFCETIWDFSWRVVNDSKPCMRTSFEKTLENPNDMVAKKYAHQKHGFRLLKSEESSSLTTYPNAFLFISTSLIYLSNFIF